MLTPDFSSLGHDLLIRSKFAPRNGVVRRRPQPSLARQLGNYVESHSNGDVDTLLPSGFEPVRAASPSVIPATPINPRLSHTAISGRLLFRFGGDSNARNFSVQHAEKAAGPWIDHDLSTATRVILDELTPGKVYYSRSRGSRRRRLK